MMRNAECNTVMCTDHSEWDCLLIGFRLLEESITEDVSGRYGNVKPENFEQKMFHPQHLQPVTCSLSAGAPSSTNHELTLSRCSALNQSHAHSQRVLHPQPITCSHSAGAPPSTNHELTLSRCSALDQSRPHSQQVLRPGPITSSHSAGARSSTNHELTLSRCSALNQSRAHTAPTLRHSIEMYLRLIPSINGVCESSIRNQTVPPCVEWCSAF